MMMWSWCAEIAPNATVREPQAENFFDKIEVRTAVLALEACDGGFCSRWYHPVVALHVVGLCESAKRTVTKSGLVRKRREAGSGCKDPRVEMHATQRLDGASCRLSAPTRPAAAAHY